MPKFVLVIAALLLAGCGGSTDSAGGVTVTGAFVKAVDATTQPPYMTGAFMTIHNDTDAEVTLVGGSAAFAAKVEVHEVVGGVMRRKAGGLRIPAHGEATLAMGASHVMLMGMSEPLSAGDEVTFSLTFTGAEPLSITAPVKMTNAGSESYTATMASGSSM